MGGNPSSERVARNWSVAASVQVLLVVFAAALLASFMVPFVSQAHAAKGGPVVNHSNMHVFMTMPDGRRADVTEVVMTLNGDSKVNVKFEVVSGAQPSRASWLSYELVDVDPGGNDKLIKRSGSPTFSVPLVDLISLERPALRVMEVKSTHDLSVVVDRRNLNIVIADVKKAESKVPKSGWSISNGVNIKLGGTSPGGFFKDMTLNLAAIVLPVTYKHKSDGTTVVGINCDANDMAFYKAVKNRNVWQKYSDKGLDDMIKGMGKGLDGKGVGTWGSKGIDWSIAGFAEFKTKDPDAPWTVTLVGTFGMRFAKSAQYYCLTGTLSGKAAAKFLGSLTRNPKADSYSGYLDVGGVGALELFGGLGYGTIAAVGVYGRGTLEVMLGLLPKSNFGFKSVSVAGDAGIKAVAFNFDIVRWVILEPKESPYYLYQRDKKKVQAASVASQAEAGGERVGVSAPAATPADVRADAVYPEVSRNYLKNDSSWTGGGLVAGTSPALSTQASTLVKGIYGATDLVCAETKSGPVIAYIADAEQVGVKGRDSANRTVLVYSRYRGGKWTDPKPIDATSKQYGNTPDYNPSIYALPDGDDFYVAWLDAEKPLPANSTIGSVAKQLNVRFARVKADDTINTSEVIIPDLLEKGFVNGSPAVYVDKIDESASGDDRNYRTWVAWSTNQETGANGEVIGMSGAHQVYLAAANLGSVVAEPNSSSVWGKYKASPKDSGAITSLSVGKLVHNGKPTVAVAFSLDKNYASRFKKEGSGWSTYTFSDLGSLDDSTVYKMVQTTSSSGAATAEISKVADRAGNAQFITANGASTLAYTKWARADDNGNYCSVYDANGDSLLLDGKSADLPTPAVKIAGDIGGGAGAGMVTCMRTNKAAGVAALVKKGSTSKDWSKLVDATDAKTNVTGYSVVYHEGKPMIVFTVAANASGLSVQSEDDDESVSMEVASGDALRDVNVEGVYYDEMEVDAGQSMPVDVAFVNDGVVPLEGAEIYLYNEIVDDEPVLVASTDDVVQPGDEGEITFAMRLPASDAFKQNLDYHLLIVPKGSTGVSAEAMMEEGDSSFEFTLGKPHLTLETEHRLVDGQESVVAMVKNEGMVTSKPATLVFECSADGTKLERIKVPALAENQDFKYEYKAKESYFQNSDVEGLTIMLDDPNDPDNAYSLYNTDGVYTWDTGGEVGESYEVGGNAYKVTSNSKDTVTFVKAKRAKKVTIPPTVRIYDKTYRVTAIAPKSFKNASAKVKIAVIGANVSKIGKAAFKGCPKLKKLVVKTKKLTKKNVKGSLEGSQIKAIKVKVGKAKVNKAYAKKYKKVFAKKNSGRAVTVKA